MKDRIFAEYPDVVSAKELQTMLHIGRNTAYSLLKSGAVSNIRIGKKYIIPKASVEEFLRRDHWSSFVSEHHCLRSIQREQN